MNFPILPSDFYILKIKHINMNNDNNLINPNGHFTGIGKRSRPDFDEDSTLLPPRKRRQTTHGEATPVVIEIPDEQSSEETSLYIDDDSEMNASSSEETSDDYETLWNRIDWQNSQITDLKNDIVDLKKRILQLEKKILVNQIINKYQ